MVKKGYFCRGAVILSAVALAGTLVACSSSTSLNTEVENQQSAAVATNVKTAGAEKSVATLDEDENAEDNKASDASSTAKSSTVEKGSKTFGSAKTSDKEDSTADKASSSSNNSDKKSTTTSKNSKASSDKKDSTKATSSTWSLDQDCAICHTVEGDSMEDDKFVACTHVKEAEATCGTCHTDEDALAEVHDKAKATTKVPKKLKKTTIEAETCLSSDCHDLTTDELVELTEDITDCTDSKGTMVNPHEVMGLTPGHDNITCGNCHKMHAEEIDAAKTCVSCHHAGVYECNTCH